MMLLLPTVLALAGPAAGCTLTPPSDSTLVAKLDANATAGETTACQEQLAKAVAADGLEGETRLLSDAAVRQAHNCDKTSMVCLRPDGSLLPDEKLPQVLRPGDKLSVAVVGCEKLREGVTFAISITEAGHADRLFRVPLTESTTADAVVAKAGVETDIPAARICQSAEDIKPLGTDEVTLSSKSNVDRVDVALTPDDAKAKYEDLVYGKRTHSIEVRQGRYFLDVGILVPVTIQGSRNIVASDTPGADQGVLDIQSKTPRPSPALMLNVFPGGRTSGAFTSFTRTRCNKAKADYFECQRRKHRRNAANSLGVQVGLDLDFSDVADAFYVGGLFEPITGLSFNAGISMREGNFLKPGYQVGQLITSDEDRQGDERYMVRPYVGITLSADIIRMLVQFRDNARSGNNGGE